MGNHLHQLLAVESDLSKQSRNILEETINTFTKKHDHFDGVKKVYTPWNEGDTKVEPEIKELITTVNEKLAYVVESFTRSGDATLSKEETNASGKASAELILDGINFGKFAATSLIALEKRLVDFRAVLKLIPTLDPARTWKKDESSGRAIFLAPVEQKYRTVKKQKVLTLSPATERFPAQTQLVTEEEQVGTYDTTFTSGRLSVAEKSEMLSRIDNLILEVKQTREKANQVDAVQVKVMGKIMDYVLNGKK